MLSEAPSLSLSLSLSLILSLSLSTSLSISLSLSRRDAAAHRHCGGQRGGSGAAARAEGRRQPGQRCRIHTAHGRREAGQRQLRALAVRA